MTPGKHTSMTFHLRHGMVIPQCGSGCALSRRPGQPFPPPPAEVSRKRVAPLPTLGCSPRALPTASEARRCCQRHHRGGKAGAPFRDAPAQTPRPAGAVYQRGRGASAAAAATAFPAQRKRPLGPLPPPSDAATACSPPGLCDRIGPDAPPGMPQMRACPRGAHRRAPPAASPTEGTRSTRPAPRNGDKRPCRRVETGGNRDHEGNTLSALSGERSVARRGVRWAGGWTAPCERSLFDLPRAAGSTSWERLRWA